MLRIIRDRGRRCHSALPVIVLMGFMVAAGVHASDDSPAQDRLFNTNPLAQRGISPEVLDAVVSLPSQGPAFTIDLSVDKTTFLVGLYKDFRRSWNATLLAGFGARDQLTMTLGYRF